MDWETIKPLVDIGLGGIALVLYAKQGRFLARLATSFEAHVTMTDKRLTKLEKRKK